MSFYRTLATSADSLIQKLIMCLNFKKSGHSRQSFLVATSSTELKLRRTSDQLTLGTFKHTPFTVRHTTRHSVHDHPCVSKSNFINTLDANDNRTLVHAMQILGYATDRKAESTVSDDCT